MFFKRKFLIPYKRNPFTQEEKEVVMKILEKAENLTKSYIISRN